KTFGLPDSRKAEPNYKSEGVLQRELYDSGVGLTGNERIRDLAKCIAVQGRVWISFQAGICHIERFSPDLQLLTLAWLEDPRKAQVQLPVSRTGNICSPHVAERADIRLHERLRI